MRRPLSPQSRFLLRASLCFGALLCVWWLVLLKPLLLWARLSTDLLLSVAPGATLQSGVRVEPDSTWVLQTPVKVRGIWRNIRVETGQRLPTQLTAGLPLFWAILL